MLVNKTPFPPRNGLLTVVCWVLFDSDVEEGGVKPVQSNADVCDGVQDYFCIQVLNKVVM